VLETLVFLALAAGQLRACHRALSIGGGLLSGSRQSQAESADVAARRLAVAVCVFVLS
jgi:hypothetical protein